MRFFLYCLLAQSLAGLCACGPARQTFCAGKNAPAAGLPAITGLQGGTRAAAIAGPGWLELDPQAYSLSSGATNEGDGSVSLDATAALAYAVYSLGGFPGSDVMPTSARVTVEPGGGNFFVAFSDYVAGHWGLAGPFAGSAEVEQPLPDGAAGYGGPEAFVSAAGVTHFAVVVNPGDSVQIVGVEIGLAESADVPAPVSFARYTGLASPLVLTWGPSPSYKQLDFAGYLIERAPRYFGDFESLTPAPVADLHFLDSTADPAQKYRIRVAAVDSSGDQSAWFTTTGPSSEAADPICILDVPEGPLVGPVEVTFDMSASFDPLGEEIGDYQITLDSSGPTAMGTEPVKVIELQPGSYSIGASIVTQDTFRYGSTQRQLTVLPQWEAAPVVIREPSEGNDNQYQGADCYRDQETGRLVFTTYDRNIPGLTFIRDLGGGSYESLVAPPIEASQYYEPYKVGPAHALPLCNGMFTHAIATAEGGEPRYLYVSGTYAQPGQVITSFADAEGDFWLVKRVRSDLRAYKLDDPAQFTDFNVSAVDCQWACPLLDETSGRVHIAAVVYNVAAEYHLRYIDFNPADGTYDVENVGQLECYYPDLEISPATGQPGIAALDNQGYVFFTQRNGANDWTAPVPVDNSNSNGPFDLEYGQSGALVYLSVVTVQLYEYIGANFSVRNDPSFTADLADSLAMEPVPGTDDMECITAVSTGETYHATLHADGTDTVHKEFLPQEACAQHISAVASGGYLHVVSRSGIDDHSEHFEYDPFGSRVQPLASFGASRWQELATTSDGTVYAAYGNDIEQMLDYWTGSAWDRVKVEGAGPTHMALLSNAIESAVSSIFYTGTPTATLKYFHGNDSGDSVQDYSYASQILFGSISGSAGFARALIAEGPLFSSNVENIVLWRQSNQLRTPLYDPPAMPRRSTSTL